jgi:hypothetical protein
MSTYGLISLEAAGLLFHPHQPLFMRKTAVCKPESDIKSDQMPQSDIPVATLPWHVESGTVFVQPDHWVANIIGQHGLKREGNLPPIRYDAIESALVHVAEEAAAYSATVHMPRIGCGLAGGSWEQIEPILDRTLCKNGVEVFVYDFE